MFVGETPYTEAIYALWSDVRAYDATRHGPPYLPEKAMHIARLVDQEDVEIQTYLAQSSEAYGGAPYCQLSALLAYIKAEAWIHQSNHWQTNGSTYHGDHLLFERLYTEAEELVDGLAERAVGLGGTALVAPVVQHLIMAKAVQSLGRNLAPKPSADVCVKVSWLAVTRVLALAQRVYDSLQTAGLLTPGLDNLIQGIMDKHEQFSYLLKQRVDGIR